MILTTLFLLARIALLQSGAGAVQGTSSVEFVLRNATSQRIYVQLSGFEGQAFWRLLRHERPIQADHDCEICLCRSPCAVCGRSLATVREIEPGKSYAWSWSGQEWTRIRSQPENQAECEESRKAEAGEVSVLVLYAFTVRTERTFGANDTLVGPTRTVTATFSHPNTRRVELVAR